MEDEDQAKLIIGNFVQARWGKTWLSAKVLETRTVPESIFATEKRKQEVKVRFQGHYKYDDRWIPFPSPRIRPQIILSRFAGKGKAGSFTRPGDRVRVLQVDTVCSSCYIARGFGMPGIVVRGRPEWDATYVRVLTLLSEADAINAGGGRGAKCEAGQGPLPPSPTRLLGSAAGDSVRVGKSEVERTKNSVAGYAGILNDAAIHSAKAAVLQETFGSSWKGIKDVNGDEEEEEDDMCIDRPLREGELVAVFWNAHIERVGEADFLAMMKETKALRQEITQVAIFAETIRSKSLGI